MTIFNPLDRFYKSQTGAVKEQKQITFRVKGDFDSVVFVLRKDGADTESRYEMSKIQDYFELKLKLNVGLYFYRFDLCNGFFIGQNNEFLGEITDKPVEFQLSVYKKKFTTPEWIKGGVIYQIFPDRFCRYGNYDKTNGNQVLRTWGETPYFKPNEQGKVLNNDFFGGNLRGIIEKLDYVALLGVTVIYLNPIFKAHSNHRYDTGDFMSVDPILGTESDLRELISKAEDLGIKIVLDGVFNHVGDDSVYFNKYGRYSSVGAYQSKDSPYYKWFRFYDYPDRYESWWGIDTLPQVEESEQTYIDFITGKNGVLERYTELGIGGWRLDVVDELPGFFVKKIRGAVKNVNKDAVIIGEVWEDASNKVSYGERREYFLGEELDSVMNYPLKDAIIDFVKSGNEKRLLRVINEQLDHYPESVLNSLMNILSTHDTYRLLSALDEKDVSGLTKEQTVNLKIEGARLEKVKKKLKAATLLQYTLFGIPSLYYGDEVGMQGYSDPLNRRCFPWDEIDEELLEWYRLLGSLRAKYSCFANGRLEKLYAKDGVMAYSRKNAESQVAVVANLGKRSIELNFKGKLVDLIEEKEYVNGLTVEAGDLMVLIAPQSVLVD